MVRTCQRSQLTAYRLLAKDHGWHKKCARAKEREGEKRAGCGNSPSLAVPPSDPSVRNIKRIVGALHETQEFSLLIVPGSKNGSGNIDNNRRWSCPIYWLTPRVAEPMVKSLTVSPPSTALPSYPILGNWFLILSPRRPPCNVTRACHFGQYDGCSWSN